VEAAEERSKAGRESGPPPALERQGTGMNRVNLELAVRSFNVAARFIRAQPGGVERLLAEHRPDGHGLCCGCTTPGTGVPHAEWPCSVAKLAQAAARL